MGRISPLNTEIERRRAAEDALRRLLIAVEQVEYIGLGDEVYQAAMSDARAVLRAADPQAPELGT